MGQGIIIGDTQMDFVIYEDWQVMIILYYSMQPQPSNYSYTSIYTSTLELDPHLDPPPLNLDLTYRYGTRVTRFKKESLLTTHLFRIIDRQTHGFIHARRGVPVREVVGVAPRVIDRY